jgi:hypothetical protein
MMNRRKFLKHLAQDSAALSSYFACLGITLSACGSTSSTSPNSQCATFKWFFSSSDLDTEQHVSDLKALISQASKLGLNGIVLDCSIFESLDISAAAATSLSRLLDLQTYAASLGIDIIPLGFSVGYASSVYARNPNLLEGQLVRDLEFVVNNGIARHVPDPTIKLQNTSFDANTALANAIPDWDQDCSGSRTFLDTQITRQSGPNSKSVRFESFTAKSACNTPVGMARISQLMALKKDRTYRLTIWLRADAYVGSFNIQVYRTDGTIVTSFLCELPTTGSLEWTKFCFAFPSLDQDTLRIWLRCYDASSGRLWLDDLFLEEAPPVHVLNRSGCPLTVHMKDASSTQLVASNDYGILEDKQLGLNSYSYDRKATTYPTIDIPLGSQVYEGSTLLVSFYQYIPPYATGKISTATDKNPSYFAQLVSCLGASEVWEAWTQALISMAVLKPKRLFMSWDEIRSLYACQSCTGSAGTLDPGTLIGLACIKFAQLVEKILPATELIIWSDMLNVFQNAAQGLHYALSRTPFSAEPAHVIALHAAAEALTRKPTIMCWGDSPANTLKYFSDLGFPTMAATFYDKGDNDDSSSWLDLLKSYPHAEGIMYTTWVNDYSHLKSFSQLHPPDCNAK